MEPRPLLKPLSCFGFSALWLVPRHASAPPLTLCQKRQGGSSSASEHSQRLHHTRFTPIHSNYHCQLIQLESPVALPQPAETKNCHLTSINLCKSNPASCYCSSPSPLSYPGRWSANMPPMPPSAQRRGPSWVDKRVYSSSRIPQVLS